MNNWAPHLSMESELHRLDQHIGANPEDVGACFDRAICLTELGRYEEARDAYLTILQSEHTHFGALNNLGALLSKMGFQSAARTAYSEAIKHHPDNPMAHVNLANAYAHSHDTEPALKHFHIALQLAPEHAQAHQGLAYVLSNIGDEENASVHRQLGFKNQPILVFPYRGDKVPVVLLLLASAVGKAVPIQHHLDDKVFFTSVLFVEFYDERFPFPPHHLVFNAIGDADIGAEALHMAQKLLDKTTAPVINPPMKVLPTGRAGNAQRLGIIPGVVTAKTVLLPREQVTIPLLARHGITFPFLIRSPGFHTGKYFMQIHNTNELETALAVLPGPELMAIEYIDTRGSDGKFRKYRVMMIDGAIYPLHAAVSHSWKVHYFSADMKGNAEHCGEDEAFLNDMAGTIGPHAIRGLEQLCAALELDYAGVDFGLNDEGDIVLFEANATMFVDLPGADEQWAYRNAPVRRIMEAIRAMFLNRAHTNLILTQLPCPA